MIISDWRPIGEVCVMRWALLVFLDCVDGLRVLGGGVDGGRGGRGLASHLRQPHQRLGLAGNLIVTCNCSASLLGAAHAGSPGEPRARGGAGGGGDGRAGRVPVLHPRGLHLELGQVGT
jgi:hypothetical protein